MRKQPLPFSPLIDFVWTRPTRCQGEELAAGAAVDKTLFDERRLRALFMTRRIAPVGFGPTPPPTFLENGRGLADKLAAELEKEEGDASDSHAGKPAAAKAPAARSARSKPAPTPKQGAAKKAAKPGTKRSAATTARA